MSGRNVIPPNERATIGAIITIAEPGGGIKVRAYSGCNPRDAARLAAEWCDRLGDEWRIRTISTPQSIYADLSYDATKNNKATQEERLLGAVGRSDRVEKLAASHTTARRKRRATA